MRNPGQFASFAYIEKHCYRQNRLLNICESRALHLNLVGPVPFSIHLIAFLLLWTDESFEHRAYTHPLNSTHGSSMQLQTIRLSAGSGLLSAKTASQLKPVQCSVQSSFSNPRPFTEMQLTRRHIYTKNHHGHFLVKKLLVHQKNPVWVPVLYTRVLLSGHSRDISSGVDPPGSSNSYQIYCPNPPTMGGTDILTMKVARAQTLDRWSLSISRNFLAMSQLYFAIRSQLHGMPEA